MTTNTLKVQSYTIKEVSELSGLSESTLRYYETIGLIYPIRRGSSSKQREYSEADLDEALAIACLNATGMSIDDMRTYLHNKKRGKEAAQEQVELFVTHKRRLEEEAYYLQVRQHYIDVKIAAWKALAAGDTDQLQALGQEAIQIARELKSGRGRLLNP